MADKVQIDSKIFFQRLKALHHAWKTSLKDNQDDVFKGMDLLAICLGKNNEDKSYQKSNVLQLWLFGFEFPETLILISKTKFAVLTSVKKAAILNVLKEKATDVKVEIVTKTKEDSNAAKFQELVDTLKGTYTGKKIGVIEKDQHDGDFFKDWTTFMASRFEKVDSSEAIAEVLSTKDDASLGDIKLACDVTSCLLRRHVIEKMETIIDEEQKITHSKISDEVDQFLTNDPKALKKIKAPQEASSDLVDWAYSPIFQSGGNYDLRASASSDDNNLHFGTILCSLGTRYNSYCSNIARTLLISPTKEQEENYKLLLDVQQEVIRNLREGAELKNVYNRAIKLIAAKKPELQAHFTKNCGFGIGLEFKESAFMISPKSEAVASARMVFNVVVGFQDLKKNGGEKPEDTYALLLADTVEVTKTEGRVLTDYKKKLEDISYTLDDQEESKEKAEEPKVKSEEKPKVKAEEPSKAKLEEKPKVKAEGQPKEKAKIKEEPKVKGVIMDEKLRSKNNPSASKEEQRREKQLALFEKMQENAKTRYSGDGGKKAASQIAQKRAESYKKPSDMPIETKSGQVHVDVKRETVILPIFGYAVPFHVSMLKNPSYTAPASENDEGSLRLNFVIPGRGGAGKDVPNIDMSTEPNFIGEMTFRSQDSKLLEETARLIKELKKVSQEREQKRKEQEDLVEQPKLIEGKGSVLRDVSIRPTIEGKRVPGALIIHKNGIRYQTNTGKKVDIVFSNIKHLFFQPCDKEVLVIIHVRLKNPIMLDKKKTVDIQFYREVVDATVDETGNRRRGNNMDRDELESEETERRQRKVHNKEFKAFAKEIADKSDGFVELDEPFRELGFFGVPSRSNVFLQPTAFCLVHLTEPPFFIVSLEEIELVYFERIEHGLKNFDMVFIFKDYKKLPAHVNTIPMQQFENIKDWLDESEIPYAEGKTNLGWPAIMKHINEDVPAFFEEGGWEFLLPDAANEEEEESESGSDFQISEEEEEEEEESTEYSGNSESDYSGSSGSEASEIETPSESEGEDWSDLEEKAAKADRNRPDLAEEDERPKKKRK